MIALLAFACKKDKDKNAPTVDTFTINGEALEVSVNAGTDMQVEMTYSDNLELNQYRMEIKESFSKANGFDPFSFVAVNDLNGTNGSDQLNISIPNSIVAGPYEATLTVIDKKGNESITSTIILLLLNKIFRLLLTLPPPISARISRSKKATRWICTA